MISATTRCMRIRSGLRPLVGAAAVGVLFAGCDVDSLLDVPTEDIVPGDVAQDQANLTGLRNGVLFEFARAYTGPSGSNEIPGIIGTSGVFSDEQWYSSTFPTMREIDARDIVTTNGALLLVFQYIQRARNWAEVAMEQYATGPLAGNADHGLVTNLAGYTYIFFGENFCSGVPFGRATLGAELEYGPGRTTEEMFNLAIERFDAAMAVGQALGTAAGTAQVNLARVGKARALLNLGRYAEAAAVAAQVPAGFVRVVNYSPNASGQNNGIWGQINSTRRSSLASREGTVNRGLDYFNRDGTTAATMTTDPRVPVPTRSLGIGTTIPVFRTGKYATMGSAAPLASYVEARLIVAEHLLADGASSAYLTELNQLRADLPSLLGQIGVTGTATALPALTDPGTREGRIRQLFSERARWLHLQAVRLGDLRRMMRQYGFAENEVFPTGTTIFGRPYGNDVNMPIPFQEGNNPLQGTGVCFDRLP
jgi:starch-binding outer membrane protein, SusD/RagB family